MYSLLLKLKQSKSGRICFLGATAFFLLYFAAGCGAIGDSLRFWGEKSRRNQVKLKKQEIEQWQRDLNYNKKQVLELHKAIADLVATSRSQGLVSWKIARAYMQAGQFEMGAAYINEALKGRLPAEEPPHVSYDQILVLLQDALRRLPPKPDLLFDAGLCYANASRARGWEAKRFEAAVLLFQELLRKNPNEGRALYELGLMYGKATNQYRDPERAIRYLDRLLRFEDKHIPGRFARAHILAEMGRLSDARREYEEIQRQLKILEDKGVIRNAARTPNYRQAAKNIEKLDVCLSGSPGCEL